MEIRTIIERKNSVQYDGTNGQEIAVELFEADPANVTDDGTTLVFEHPNGETYQAQAGDHILFIDNRGIGSARCDWYGKVSDATFDQRYFTKESLDTQIAALAARITELENPA